MATHTSPAATLGIIGCGTMAEAMLARILDANLLPVAAIVCSHPRAERRSVLTEKYGVRCVEANAVVLEHADIVLLGIKPQMLPTVMQEISGSLRPGQVIVSIVAGATLKALSDGLSHGFIIRTMPSTPAQIGKGVTVWCATPDVPPQTKAQVDTLLSSFGRSIEVHDERQVAMATALSGTGPTYIFLFLEAMIDAGVHMGFPRHIAREIVLDTVIGSAEFALQSGKHVGELRDMVTSPGGTSAEALYQMEAGRLKTVISDAVWAAFGRTLELEARLEHRPVHEHPKGTPGRP